MVLISVIIPTYNRPDLLKACLESLVRQNLPTDQFEVIVVNDGGNANLEVHVERYLAQLNLRLLNQTNVGPASARNTGVASACGKFLAFTDDDCTPDPDWLVVLSSCLKSNPTGMYGGHTVNALKSNVYSAASQLLIDYLYEFYNTGSGPASFFTSNNMAMAKQQMEQLGGFDTSFPGAYGEDRELCARWLNAGFGMTYVPRAIVRHRHSLNLFTFFRQHFNYGKGAWYFRQSLARQKLAMPRMEPWSFYWKLISCAWRKGKKPWLYLAFLMVLSQAANAFGFYYKNLRR